MLSYKVLVIALMILAMVILSLLIARWPTSFSSPNASHRDLNRIQFTG